MEASDSVLICDECCRAATFAAPNLQSPFIGTFHDYEFMKHECTLLEESQRLVERCQNEHPDWDDTAISDWINKTLKTFRRGDHSINPQLHYALQDPTLFDFSGRIPFLGYPRELWQNKQAYNLAMMRLLEPVIEAHAAVCGSLPEIDFGTYKTHTQTTQRMPHRIPEFQAIKRGVYVDYVGLFINHGSAQSYAFDADTGEVIMVEHRAGRHFDPALVVQTPTATHYSRMPTVDGAVIDIVTKTHATPKEQTELIGIANFLWAFQSRCLSSATDISNMVVLFDDHAHKTLGGMGFLVGAASAFKKQLEDVISKVS